MDQNDWIISKDDPVLVTGASGFIGSRVVKSLLDTGINHIRCLVRPSSNLSKLNELNNMYGNNRLEIVPANLLKPEDCRHIFKDIFIIFHLAAGTGTKSFSDAYLNSAVITRNVIEAALEAKTIRRFVNISSMSVYSPFATIRHNVIDENCGMHENPLIPGSAYIYAKVKQDEMVLRYAKEKSLPYVILRPGVVYGEGKKNIHGRIGIDTFGFFMHLGGSNKIPFTYVENCADAIVMAGLKKGINGEIYNVVDDNLPTSRKFLVLYKKNVRRFFSLSVPHSISYLLCTIWEWLSKWSKGQLPPVYNRTDWAISWRKNRYPNQKIKKEIGWIPSIHTDEGLNRYFTFCRNEELKKC